jgi:hypothetical protein
MKIRHRMTCLRSAPDGDHARAQRGISQAGLRPHPAHVGWIDLMGLAG